MKKYFLILVVFCACCVKPEAPPANIIPMDTMACIMIDIHIAEAKVTSKAMFPDTSAMFYESYRRNLYGNKYNIPPERFESSFEYYSRNLKLLDEIYETVVDSLGLMEGRGRLQ